MLAVFRRLYVLGAIAVLAACGGNTGARGSLPPTGLVPANSEISEPLLATIKISRVDQRRVMARVTSARAHGTPQVSRQQQSITPYANMHYHGGPTLSDAGSVNVYVNKPASNWSFPGSFIKHYSKSSLNELMEVYTGVSGDNQYRFIGGINATYDTSQTLQDADIFAILTAAQAAFAASERSEGRSSTGYHVIYHIFLDAGVTGCSNALSGLCYGKPFTGFCAYHGNVDINGVGHILFSVEAWQERRGCESPSGTLQDSMASLLSHELSEIITDPDINAWYDDRGNEIGDICRFDYGSLGPIAGVTYNIQKEWLNDHACAFGPLRPGNITEFQSSLFVAPLRITSGPEGNLWFTDVSAIGRITPAGTVTEFTTGISLNAGLDGITNGPDGNLWFTEYNISQIGRITPAGVVTEFSTGISPASYPSSITTGADGNLWFTEYFTNRIGRITPAGVVTEFSNGITPRSGPFEITSGPDGNLWFTEANVPKIGRITPAGTVTEFSTWSSAFGFFGITSGPDGNVWFTEATFNSAGHIGRITPAGAVTKFSGMTGMFGARQITTGPDGNLWFAEPGFPPGYACVGCAADHIGRITPAGVVTEFFNGLSAGAAPDAITSGPDGNLWFTELSAKQIGRLTPPDPR